jgi:Cys-rich four helix bundle protein (predicted Tat secretion target)
MNRRDLLSGIGAVGAMAATRAALAQQTQPTKPAAGHEHHHTGAAAHQALIDATHECMAAGDACIQHCIDRLSAGDKTLGDCARSVEQMVAMVTAVSKLAAQNAPRLKELAKICGKACRDCEAECRKHEQHPPCKRCAEACVKCAAECDKV